VRAFLAVQFNKQSAVGLDDAVDLEAQRLGHEGNVGGLGNADEQSGGEVSYQITFT
jgi:hypothetical protein